MTRKETLKHNCAAYLIRMIFGEYLNKSSQVLRQGNVLDWYSGHFRDYTTSDLSDICEREINSTLEELL